MLPLLIGTGCVQSIPIIFALSLSITNKTFCRAQTFRRSCRVPVSSAVRSIIVIFRGFPGDFANRSHSVPIVWPLRSARSQFLSMPTDDTTRHETRETTLNLNLVRFTLVDTRLYLLATPSETKLPLPCTVNV
jgi:hypothetical protein